MEEDLMQSAQGISLLFALLEIDPPDSTQIYLQGHSQAAQKASQSKADEYRNLDPGDKAKVMGGLYRVLYSIIEGYDFPYHRMLNRGIGKALSIGIREEMMKPNPDKDIKRLFDMLKPAVTDAIEEIKPY
jgi:hypothetical protein